MPFSIPLRDMSSRHHRRHYDQHSRNCAEGGLPRATKNAALRQSISATIKQQQPCRPYIRLTFTDRCADCTCVTLSEPRMCPRVAHVSTQNGSPHVEIDARSAVSCETKVFEASPLNNKARMVRRYVGATYLCRCGVAPRAYAQHRFLPSQMSPRVLGWRL